MNLRRLWAVARKETIHIFRDPRSLILAIGIPMLLIVLFGYALTVDVDRVPFAVWDQSGTPASRDLVARFEASRYFEIRRVVESYAELERSLDRRETLLALVIDTRFAEHLEAGRAAGLQAIVEGSDSNTAGIVFGYVQGVVSELDQELALEHVRRAGGSGVVAPIDVRSRAWFNADLESKNFIIPGITAVIMGLIAALLTSLTIAREWERGTMEQLVSTPVKAPELILGKLLPYFVVGMVDFLIAVLMGVFVFDVPLRGSVMLLVAVASLFIVGTLAQGILISTVAKGQLVASQMAMVSTFLPAFLLSGFMFAISNMPAVVQLITYVVPARYFVAIVKGIYLRGVGIETLWRDALFLTGFALIVATLAVKTFRKQII